VSYLKIVVEKAMLRRELGKEHEHLAMEQHR